MNFLKKYSRLIKYGFLYRSRIIKQIKGEKNKLLYPRLFVKANIQITGSDNRILINKNVRINESKIIIKGNHNVVELGENVHFNNSGLIWIEDDHCILKIGKDTTIENVSFAITENYSRIEIGEDCMFAYNIEVKTGDSHSIIDLKTNQRINYAKNVKIGNHVWVGAHAVLLKGSIIPDGCIVASNAVVTKPFEKVNTILAGNPAKIINEDVTWDRKRIEVKNR